MYSIYDLISVCLGWHKLSKSQNIVCGCTMREGIGRKYVIFSCQWPKPVQNPRTPQDTGSALVVSWKKNANFGMYVQNMILQYDIRYDIVYMLMYIVWIYDYRIRYRILYTVFNNTGNHTHKWHNRIRYCRSYIVSTFLQYSKKSLLWCARRIYILYGL